MPLKPDTKQKVKEILDRIPAEKRAKVVQLAAVNHILKRRMAENERIHAENSQQKTKQPENGLVYVVPVEKSLQTRLEGTGAVKLVKITLPPRAEQPKNEDNERLNIAPSSFDQKVTNDPGDWD